jgi:type I restriction enzyme S subunit
VKEELEAIPALLDQFRQSVLAAAFRGDLTADWREKNIPYEPGIESKKLPSSPNPPIVIGEGEGYLPASWMWIPLIKVAKLESGHTPRKSVPEYWEGGDVPWISLQDIRAAHGKTIFDTLSMPTMLGIKNSSARLLPEGTVCFSRDISVGFVTLMGRSMATTQHFANWICGAKLFNKYLMYAFIAARSSLIQLGEGTTVRTIYMPALKKMQVLLPPIEEQYEIVCKIEALFKTADRIEQQDKEARANLAQLNQSILAKAFRGELVPQDPKDEPASVLLERIRAEREKLDTKKKAKGKTEKKSHKAKPEAAEPEQLSLPGFE